MTLLELLVVVVLLGLMAAAVAPVLRLPASDRRAVASVDAVLAVARGVATRRGEEVRLTLAASGDWRVGAMGDAGEETVRSGRVSPTASAQNQTYRITPLGLCFPEGAAPAGAPTWDVARCAPVLR